jgi:hypothetical protein
MKRVYTYPVRSGEWVIGLPFAFLSICLGSVVITASLGLKTLPDQLVAAAFGMLFLVVGLFGTAFMILRHAGIVHVVVSDRGLIIKNALTTRSINWVDITEFGTCRRIGRFPVRIYYVKTKARPDHPITVCSQFLDDVDSFINDVFHMATNARFLRVENDALIPFTKNVSSMPWNRDSETSS